MDQQDQQDQLENIFKRYQLLLKRSFSKHLNFSHHLKTFQLNYFTINVICDICILGINRQSARERHIKRILEIRIALSFI